MGLDLNNKFIFRQSSLSTMSRCPRQFYYSYILGIKSRPAAALTLGSAVDSGVYYNLDQKIKTKEDLPVKQIVEAFADSFDKKVKYENENHEDGIDWKESSPVKEKYIGISCIEVHTKLLAPKINPTHTQVKFDIELSDKPYDITGTMDHIEEGGKLVDTKTCNPKTITQNYPENVVNKTWQFPMYNFAYKKLFGSEPSSCEYQVLSKAENAKTPVRITSGKITKQDTTHLFNAMDAAYLSIKAGAFPMCDPGSWACSESWCGYWKLCRGKK